MAGQRETHSHPRVRAVSILVVAFLWGMFCTDQAIALPHPMGEVDSPSRAGLSDEADEAPTIAGCPLPSDPGDACSFAPACLADLLDADAAAWLAAATFQPPLVFESFPTQDEEDYSDLWFLGPAEQRSFEADEPGDFSLKLVGTNLGGAEVQSQGGVLPFARERIRVWFRFRHQTRADLLNDSTLGLEHFELDMEGGFLGIGSGTPCFTDCQSAQQGGSQCDSGPPASCTPDLATHAAHFGLLLDLDQDLQSTSFAGLFADGSPCGHLSCSPWGAAFQGQSPAFDPALWHLLLIEYRPDADTGTTFCFDGSELATDQLTSLLPSLLSALTSTTRSLRLRVSANREAGATEDQIIEVDWFAFHNVPIFGDGFESGDTARWTVTIP